MKYLAKVEERARDGSKGPFTCNVFQPVSVIATDKVQHCVSDDDDDDGVNNGQNE